jgi:hypothetical protein
MPQAATSPCAQVRRIINPSHPVAGLPCAMRRPDAGPREHPPELRMGHTSQLQPVGLRAR